MFTKYILPALIIGVAILLAVIIIAFGKSSPKEKYIRPSTTDGFIKKPYYIKHKNIDMFKAIKEVMPENVNIQLKVTLDTFIKYNGYEMEKKKLLTKYVDVPVCAGLCIRENDRDRGG